MANPCLHKAGRGILKGWWLIHLLFLPVLFVPATGWWGGEQTAGAWPASAVRQQAPPGSHHQLKPSDRLMVCQGMKSATLRVGGCPSEYCLLYYGKYGTVYFASKHEQL